MKPMRPKNDAPPLKDRIGISRFGNQFISMSDDQDQAVQLLGAGRHPVEYDIGHEVKITPVISFSQWPFFHQSNQATVHTVAVITPLTVTVNGKTLPTSEDVPDFLHLGGANGAYYIRHTKNGWSVVPDGQSFVGWYRTIAVASPFQLFDRSIQALGQKASSPPSTTVLLTTPPSTSFERGTPYANYNWELFLHAPLAIADHYISLQRFADARRCLHAVLDPTMGNHDPSEITQAWRFLPFSNAIKPDSIAELLTWLANPSALTPEAQAKFECGFGPQITEWKKNPFMPHVIARLRPSAYQWHTFFAYLDVLIGWGDQLFRRDTRESVNEATLLYVLAAKLLGPRPRAITPPTPPPPQTYRSLRATKLDKLGNAWVPYADHHVARRLVRAQTVSLRSSQSFALKKSGEPGDHLPVPSQSKSGIHLLTSLSALAFCIPQNQKVTEFYDRIENRLFNVRHCRNIEGVFRDLPLYEPEIDPLLLIRARAAGLNIDEVLNLKAPLPNYRFSFTLQKALEPCAELKALGAALLSTLEKKDAEELTLLRSRHEIALLKLVLDTRKQQIAEAEANIAALQQSEVTILERFGQYQKLLGKPSITNGQDGLPVVEQSSALVVSTDAVGGMTGMGLIRREVDQLNLTAISHLLTLNATNAHALAGALNLIPNIFTGSCLGGGKRSEAVTWEPPSLQWPRR